MNHVNGNIRVMRDEFIEQSNSNRNVHDHLKDLSIPELQALTQVSVYPFWVMTLNVFGELNIGTVIRSSHLMGAEKVVVFGRRKIDNRGLVGSANYTTVEREWGVKEDLEIDPDLFGEFCEKNQVVPIFIEQGGKNVFEFDWQSAITAIVRKKFKPMLVLGTENSGVPQSVMDCGKKFGSHVVSIPQRGVIRSHNLSMAFAIAAGQMIGKMGWY